jgi:hypothetical protein
MSKIIFEEFIAKASITPTLRSLLENELEYQNDKLFFDIYNNNDVNIKNLDTYKGIGIFCSKDNYNNIISNDILESFIIPENIKYLICHCDSEYYKNIKIPQHIEYLSLYLSLFDIYQNNILADIAFPSNLKSLSILINYDNPKIITNEIEDPITTQIGTADIGTADIDVDHVSIQVDIQMAIQVAIERLNKVIPYNLEYLVVNFPISNIEKFVNLKTYIISSEFDYDNFNEPLDNLPASLEWLAIYPKKFNQPLDNLPSGLKYLNVGRNRLWYYFDGYSLPLNNLPASLEILYFPEIISLDGLDYSANLRNLPTNLKILDIPEYIPSNMNFNNLPDSLEIIVWNNFIKNYEDIAKFPENLKEIYVDMYQDEIEKKFKSYSHSLNHSFNITNKYY